MIITEKAFLQILKESEERQAAYDNIINDLRLAMLYQEEVLKERETYGVALLNWMLNNTYVTVFTADGRRWSDGTYNRFDPTHKSSEELVSLFNRESNPNSNGE